MRKDIQMDVIDRQYTTKIESSAKIVAYFGGYSVHESLIESADFRLRTNKNCPSWRPR